MFYYKVFGYVFRCQYEIKQLYLVSETDGYDAEIVIGGIPEEIEQKAARAEEFPCLGWRDDLFWMHNTYGILAVYKNGNIYAKSVSDKDVFYLLQYVLGYGIAMYAHLHNRIAIHCGCVVEDGKCIMISGDSGAGKSTLINEFITDGAIMLSDDVVAVGYDEQGDTWIYPAFPQQKICRDAAVNKGYNLEELLYVDPEKDKFAVLHTEQFSAEPHKLHSAYYMQCYESEKENAGLQIKELIGFSKVSFLVNNLYLGCLIPNTGLSAEAFKLCVDTIKDCKVYQIKRPLGIDTLEEIKQSIRNMLNEETR